MAVKAVAMIIILLYNVKICQSKRYDNYALYFTTPTRYDQVKFLKNLEVRKYINIIFWRRPNLLHQEVHCIVAPEDKKQFYQRAHHFGLTLHEKLRDVQGAFDKQYIKKYIRTQTKTKNETGYNWKYYHNLEDTYQWLKDMALQYPNKTKMRSIGKSAEGRDIYAFSVRYSRRPRNKVMVEGGIHGHEWIAIEFVTYLVSVLLGQQKNERLLDLAKQYVWFLIPVVNPDGFEYSQKEDRLWRKNRRPQSKNNGTGVDLNRNFDYKWGKFDSSKDPHDGYYCGNRPFSEPETKALRNFIHQQKINLRFYFSIHAYGQQLIIPYSDRTKHLDNFREAQIVGKRAVQKMHKVHGSTYSIGSNYDTWGNQISGNTESWVKNTIRLRYVYTFLLRDEGTYGYALPATEILPTCEEAAAGLTELMAARPKRVKLASAKNRAQKSKGANFMLFCGLILFYF